MKIILSLLLTSFILIGSFDAVADPVLVGEMQKLEVFETPQSMPELIMDGLDDKQHFLSDRRGEIILLNLWATWCPPCVDELGSLDALEEKLGGYDFKVMAISMDDGMTPDDIQEFLIEEGIENLEVYLDHESSTTKIPNLAGLPTSYILNAQGKMLARYEGDADWASPEALSVIQYYIDTKPAL